MDALQDKAKAFAWQMFVDWLASLDWMTITAVVAVGLLFFLVVSVIVDQLKRFVPWLMIGAAAFLGFAWMSRPRPVVVERPVEKARPPAERVVVVREPAPPPKIIEVPMPRLPEPEKVEEPKPEPPMPKGLTRNQKIALAKRRNAYLLGLIDQFIARGMNEIMARQEAERMWEQEMAWRSMTYVPPIRPMAPIVIPRNR